jgi:hypothetical protein
MFAAFVAASTCICCCATSAVIDKGSVSKQEKLINDLALSKTEQGCRCTLTRPLTIAPDLFDDITVDGLYFSSL